MRTRLLSGLLCAAALWAQDYAPSFPRRDYFHTTFSRPDTAVSVQPLRSAQDYVVSGKLELSLQAYLDLVLANNTDVVLQRVSLETNANAITRAYGVFDPFISLRLSSTRTSARTVDATSGATALNTLTQPLSFQYSQTLPTGTNYFINYNALKTSNNSAFALYNPSFSSGFTANIAQPLLRGRGSYYTKLPITVARSRQRVAQSTFQDSVMRLIAQAENTYWDLVSARENLRVQEQALALAAESLKRAKRELELGATSPLDIFQPEQQYATAEIGVSQARFNVLRVEDVLRRQIGVDVDPEIRKLPVVLTESADAPRQEETFDREAIVNKALQQRPDLLSFHQSVDVDDLSIKLYKNLLLPNVSLTGQYGTSGIGGNFYDRQNVFLQDGTRNTLVSVAPGGFSDALSQMFGFGFPVYGFGLSIQLPVRDHVNLANLADARTNKRQDLLSIRRTEQIIRQEVLTAITQVESDRAAIRLSQTALEYAQKRVDAEQKKYDLGTTTIFFVLSAQTDLTRAQSDLVNQLIQYRRDVLSLSLRTGDLFRDRNIVLQ